MKVYRVENESGSGPYMAGPANPAIMWHRPLDWSLTRFAFSHKEYRFGFDSLDALLEWFDQTDELLSLRKWKFKVQVYDAVAVILGDRQLIFDHTTAKPLEAIPI